jgi:hypothetical protein
MSKKLFLIFLAGLFLVSFVSAAVSSPSFCCEKLLNSSGTCINTDEASCDPQFKKAPTSCESTSYCKQGTCYDSQEGICMDNTPQTTCKANGGTWDNREAAEIPQCQLGCCVIADQAAFVPLVRCKRLSSLFGVTTDFRSNIFSEVACIATAQSQDMGACVYEEDFENTCKFTTRGECGAVEKVEVVNKTEKVVTEKVFYKDYLCSAEELGTTCARQVSTTCYQGKVYWVDSCGNRENVYSNDKTKSWNNGRVALAEEVCAPNGGSDKNCGNCDYLLGARCGEPSGIFGNNNPEFGNLICKKTTCTDRNDNLRMNGESWCVFPAEDRDNSTKTDAVGSRYFKEVCVDGVVKVEPCADFRNEVCIQGSTETSAGEFSSAACRVNRWQDCVMQMEEDDCNNIDRRDCRWMPSVSGLMIGGGSSSGTGTVPAGTKFSNPTTAMAVAPITGNAFLGMGGSEEETAAEETTTNRGSGVCVPDFAPGFNFWKDGDAQAICSQATANCIVTYEKGLIGGSWKCIEGCECLEDGWALQANQICTSLGDCGAGINYLGTYMDDGYSWTVDGEKQEFSPSARNIISASMTGFAVAPAYMVNDNLKLNSEDYVYVKAN